MSRMKFKALLPAALLLVVACLAYSDFESARNQALPWMNPVVLPGELEAMAWVRQNTAPRAVFVNDIFGGEFLMGNSLRESAVGGDWAIIPGVVQRMHDVQYSFYEAETPEQAWETAKKYGAKFVWAPQRQVFPGYEWVSVNQELFDPQYFRLAYSNPDVKIYEVLE